MSTRTQAGDTLIEVSIALAILAAILTSAFTVGTKAYRLGLSARERTQASNLMQEQVEALRNLRDSGGWSNLVATVPTDGLTKYHMVLNGGSWQPVNCVPITVCKTNLFTITVTSYRVTNVPSPPGVPSVPAVFNNAPYANNVLDVAVAAQWENAGGGTNQSSIRAHLNKL